MRNLGLLTGIKPEGSKNYPWMFLLAVAGVPVAKSGCSNVWLKTYQIQGVRSLPLALTMPCLS